MRILKLFMFILPVVFSAKAHALTLSVTTRAAVIAQSTLDTSAHWINPVTAVAAACNWKLWLPYDDKEIFATALTAQLNKMELEIWYDTAAATKTFPGYGGSSPCRVIAINLKYIP